MAAVSLDSHPTPSVSSNGRGVLAGSRCSMTGVHAHLPGEGSSQSAWANFRTGDTAFSILHPMSPQLPNESRADPRFPQKPGPLAGEA